MTNVNPNHDSTPPTGSRRGRPGLIRSPLRGLLWAAVAVVAVWLLHPWPVLLRWMEPATTGFMEHRAREAREAGEELEIQWRWVSLDTMSPHLERAVLIAEDHRFRDHRGVDWEALAEETRYRGSLPPRVWDPDDREALSEAAAYVREHRDRVRGRSTLTQQLARNLYLSPRRTFVRKAQELVITQRLELLLSKERILELYLNVAELGPGIFGVEAAAQHYFGRSAGELNARQAAALAATLPHPRSSNPALNPSRMAWRQALILERMGMAGPPAPVPPGAEVEMAPPLPPDTLRLETIGTDSVVQSDTVLQADTLIDADTLIVPDVREDAPPGASAPWGAPATR